jgi:hypothetical protein
MSTYLDQFLKEIEESDEKKPPSNDELSEEEKRAFIFRMANR